MLARTRMCRVMMRHGCDKSYPSQCITTVYSTLFKGLRNRPLRVFELGLGSNNPKIPSNMGTNGIPGASLRGWREIFPCAQVFGADIDRDILFQENQIKTFYCDQLCQQSICDLWSHPALQGGADIIIEDALHTFEANTSFLEGSLEHLRPGGIYVVEDICQDETEKWHTRFETVYSKRFPAYEFAYVTLPTDSEERHNSLLVIPPDAVPTSTAGPKLHKFKNSVVKKLYSPKSTDRLKRRVPSSDRSTRTAPNRYA
jgi:SAM-dependent methyltransferase